MITSTLQPPRLRPTPMYNIYIYIYIYILESSGALRAPLILFLPSVDLRFFTGKAFFNILSTPTKSTSKVSRILHLAPRVTFNSSLPVQHQNKGKHALPHVPKSPQNVLGRYQT